MSPRSAVPAGGAEGRRAKVLPAAGVVAVLAAAALSAAAGWRTWILPFVDSSRELHVPARIAAGERLYRDVVYYYGPAGPWINAAAIRIFGRRFAALEIAAGVAAILLFAALARLTRRAGSGFAACAALVWAAAVCVGAPNGGSFLFPYSFGALWALAGALTALAACAAPPPARAARWLAGAGIGLALLAKPEIGAAAALVMVAGAWRRDDPDATRCSALAALGIAAAVAIAGWGIAAAGLSRSAFFPEGPLALFSPPEEWRSVYRMMSGLADAAGSASAIGTALFLDLVLASAAWGFGSRAASRRPAAAALLGAALAAVCLLLLSAKAGGAIEDRLPPLLAPAPLVCGLAAVLLLRRRLATRDHARFLLFAFAAAAASRVVFGLSYARISTPYSVLAFPALAASAAVLAIDVLPRRLAFPEGARRFLFAIFIAAAGAALLRAARFHPAGAFPKIETAAGTVRLPASQAGPVAGTLAFLRSRARLGDGLAGFPEGGFFNFVTGLPNPLREEQILPGHLDARREAEVAAQVEREGPRFLLLANQPTAAFGRTAFGVDYASRIMQTVLRRYRLAAAFGDAPPDAPVGYPAFFLRLYERRNRYSDP